MTFGWGNRWGQEKGIEPDALEADQLPSPTESRGELLRDCPTSQSKDDGLGAPKHPIGLGLGTVG